VLVGSTIGSGIFRSPAGIADKLPGPLPLLAVWATGGLFALCGALTLAEVAGALPETGGLYVYIRDGWGRLPAFLFGWAELVVIRAASMGAVSLTFADYFLRVLRVDAAAAARWSHWVAAAAIVLTSTINYRGARAGRAGAELHHGGQVRRPGVHHPPRLRPRPAAHGRATSRRPRRRGASRWARSGSRS
jgi:amino acid transporter